MHRYLFSDGNIIEMRYNFTIEDLNLDKKLCTICSCRHQFVGLNRPVENLKGGIFPVLVLVYPILFHNKSNCINSKIIILLLAVVVYQSAFGCKGTPFSSRNFPLI